jgi:hypothetical protein
MLTGKPDKSTIGRWLKGDPARPRNLQQVSRIEAVLEIHGLLLPFPAFLERNPRLNEYHRTIEVVRRQYPAVLASGAHYAAGHQEDMTAETPESLMAEDDVLLVVPPESLLRGIEEVLRASVLELPYFRLYIDMRVGFEWDQSGLVRLNLWSKYAVQNRTKDSIDFRLYTGLWDVREEWIDRQLVIKRVVCRCDNRPNDPELNFEMIREADLSAHVTVVRQSRRFERYIPLPGREIMEVETERVIFVHPTDHDVFIVWTPTGRLSFTVDVQNCPGMSVRAAPIHSLPEYFRSIPDEHKGIFRWAIPTGLLPAQGILLWWRGTPPADAGI